MVPEWERSNRWMKCRQELDAALEIQRKGNVFEETWILSERERRLKYNNVVRSLDNVGNKVASGITDVKRIVYMQKNCTRHVEIRILVIAEGVSGVRSYILGTSGMRV